MRVLQFGKESAFVVFEPMCSPFPSNQTEGLRSEEPLLIGEHYFHDIP